jgi:hypothetical protein
MILPEVTQSYPFPVLSGTVALQGFYGTAGEAHIASVAVLWCFEHVPDPSLRKCTANA